MPQILIELIFILFLGGSAVWAYISKTAKTVHAGVKDKIREHEAKQAPRPANQPGQNTFSSTSSSNNLLRKDGYYIVGYFGESGEEEYHVYMFGERNVIIEMRKAPLSLQDKAEIRQARTMLTSQEYVFNNMRLPNVFQYQLANNIVSFSVSSPFEDGSLSLRGNIQPNTLILNGTLKDGNGSILEEISHRLQFFNSLP